MRRIQPFVVSRPRVPGGPSRTTSRRPQPGPSSTQPSKRNVPPRQLHNPCARSSSTPRPPRHPEPTVLPVILKPTHPFVVSLSKGLP